MKQIAATELLQKTEKVDSSDVLSAKIRLFNLFSPEKLSSDNVDETNVYALLKKGVFQFIDLQNTYFANMNILFGNIDSDTINFLCETDLELLKYVYSKKSYTFFNEKNARRLIDNKIVEDEALDLQIADRFNFSDILDRFGKINIKAGYTNIV